MKTIQQTILFDGPIETVFDFYMNEEKHAAITGEDAKISAKVGETFSTYGEYITGKNLEIAKNKLIIQTWRAADWSDDDIDSIFILSFSAKGNKTEVQMVHANVPDDKAKDLAKGWNDHYWDLWKDALKEK